MMFIDLKIGRRFSIIKYNMERGTYQTFKCVKIVPVRNKKYDVFNRYNITTDKYVFIKPTAIIRESNYEN